MPKDLNKSYSSESLQSDEEQLKKRCNGCQKTFARLTFLLKNSAPCRKLYDMDDLLKQEEAKKKAQAQARLQKFRLKQQNLDRLQGYKKKMKSEKQDQRKQKENQNIELSRENEAKSRQKRRLQEKDINEQAFKEKRAKEKQQERQNKMNQDPNAF